MDQGLICAEIGYCAEQAPLISILANSVLKWGFSSAPDCVSSILRAEQRPHPCTGSASKCAFTPIKQNRTCTSHLASEDDESANALGDGACSEELDPNHDEQDRYNDVTD